MERSEVPARVVDGLARITSTFKKSQVKHAALPGAHFVRTLAGLV